MSVFFEEPEKLLKVSPLSVVIDHREQPSGIPDILSDWNLEVKIETLKIGDYLISEKVCCERKEGRDFYSSMFSGERRLFEQAHTISEAYELPVWIVEGTIPSLPSTANSIAGALLSLSLDFNIHLLFSSNNLDTARFIRLLCKREQEDKRGTISIHRPKKPADSTQKKQLYLVSSFRGWSGEIARKALVYSHSPRKLFSLTLEDLMKIGGVGKKRAEEMTQVLDSDFIEKPKE